MKQHERANFRLYNGFLNVNKPLGLTSHDVVNHVRQLLRPISKTIRVGHAGTLDPLADGVLVLCVGDATRLSDYVMHTTKGYHATLRLGETTATYDAEGEVTAHADITQVTLRDIQECLPAFTGDILQMPPIYSAIKQNGKKLYELARAGEQVVTTPRPVRIDTIESLAYEAPLLLLNVVCGSGTYIRSLAHDLGQALRVGAHLVALTRTFSGGFVLREALDLATLTNAEILHSHLIRPYDMLQSYPSITLSPDQVQELSFGRAIAWSGNDASIVMAYNASQTLVAIGQTDSAQFRPQKVFSS